MSESVAKSANAATSPRRIVSRRQSLAWVGGIFGTVGVVWTAILLDWQPTLDWLPRLTQERILAVLVAGTVVLVVSTLWKFPQIQVARSQGVTPDNRFDRENEARKTLAQILGGIFLLAGLYSQEASLTTAREGQITDRYTKAIDQLGAKDSHDRPKLEVRVGGIYALERIAVDSERDQSVIMEVLTAYLRENSPRTGSEGKATEVSQEALPEAFQQRADIRAILTVLARRNPNYFVSAPLRLPGTDLRGADFHEADLSEIQFVRADLTRASLVRAKLRGTNFFEADLTGADLTGADLTGADLAGAILTGAILDGADLRETLHLTDEQLRNAQGSSTTKLPRLLKMPDQWKEK